MKGNRDCFRWLSKLWTVWLTQWEGLPNSCMESYLLVNFIAKATCSLENSMVLHLYWIILPRVRCLVKEPMVWWWRYCKKLFSKIILCFHQSCYSFLPAFAPQVLQIDWKKGDSFWIFQHWFPPQKFMLLFAIDEQSALVNHPEEEKFPSFACLWFDFGWSTGLVLGWLDPLSRKLQLPYTAMKKWSVWVVIFWRLFWSSPSWPGDAHILHWSKSSFFMINR